ncbi:MAG: hypothetical protein FWH35_08490 [Treponema sp.]|nr:hypothetical protein [Treponema sp.]
MGLFDNLKKTTLGKIVDTVQKTVESASGASVRPGGGSQSPSGPYAAPQNTERQADRNNFANSNMDQKFDQILASEFSDLEIIRNASPGSIGISAPEPCKPYSYALMRNGKAAAVIMLTLHNRDRNSAFLNAKKSALNSNITFLNFYTHFANERDYVVSRIKNAL